MDHQPVVLWDMRSQNAMHADKVVVLTDNLVPYPLKDTSIRRLCRFLWVEVEQQSRLGIGNDLFENTKSINRILGPKRDAFNVYDKLLEYVEKNISKDKLILLALGPTATVLAYDLYKLGYHAVDIGHIDIEYEWFLANAKDKIAIKNKYVGEAKDGMEVGDLDLEDYKRQIIAKIIN